MRRPSTGEQRDWRRLISKVYQEMNVARRILGDVELHANGESVKASALFDTGATKSYTSLKLAEKLAFVRYEKPKEVLLAVEDAKTRMVGYLTAKVVINECELPLEHTFGVVDGLREDVIVGMDIIEPYELILDVKEGKVKFKKYPPTLELF